MNAGNRGKTMRKNTMVWNGYGFEVKTENGNLIGVVPKGMCDASYNPRHVPVIQIEYEFAFELGTGKPTLIEITHGPY